MHKTLMSLESLKSDKTANPGQAEIKKKTSMLLVDCPNQLGIPKKCMHLRNPSQGFNRDRGQISSIGLHLIVGWSRTNPHHRCDIRSFSIKYPYFCLELDYHNFVFTSRIQSSKRLTRHANCGIRSTFEPSPEQMPIMVRHHCHIAFGKVSLMSSTHHFTLKQDPYP
jgi:hypothetical protein